MINLLTFYGACGHTTIEEVDDDEWVGASNSYYRVYCCDDSVRMVYVYPDTYFVCVDCKEEEIYSDEFTALRYFFHSPLGPFRGETRKEREEQTILMGRSILPEFSDEKIIKIASKISMHVNRI